MAEQPRFADGHGGKTGEGAEWKTVIGGRGGRGGFAGYGRGRGRGRGGGRGRDKSNDPNKNQYDQFDDSEFEDGEDSLEEIEDYNFTNEEDLAEEGDKTNKPETPEEDEQMNTKEHQEYEGDDFITEEEMKQTRKEDEEKTDMEGIETVIQKKRALSMEEEHENEGKNQGNTEEKQMTVKLNYSDPNNDNENGKYPHLTQAETKAMIKERGDNMIETKTTFRTNTKLEFNLSSSTTQFSVRHSTIQVLNKMKEVDKNLKVKSVSDSTEWTEMKNIPSDPELFGKHFNVREEAPPKGAKKIVIHFNLQTTVKFGDIKYEPGFLHYLKEKSIYIKVDKFEMRKMATPGFLINIHPNLTNLTNLHEELTKNMERTKMKDLTIINEWREENKDRNISTANNEIERIVKETKHKIPTFNIHSGKRSFGAEKSRVETICLIIECAATDAKYIKALLSSVYSNKESNHGMFVPSGMHLMESPQVLCNLLRRQNKYIQTTSAVPIFGMKADALQTNVILDTGENLDLEEFIKRFIPAIERVEPTNKTESDGKWFLICRQTQVQELHKFVDDTLPDIYKRFAAADDLIPGYPCPRRLPPQAKTRASPTKIVGTYAAVLREYSSNPQGDDNTADNNEEYNRAPDRPRKRQAVQLLFDNSNFPAIQGANATTTQATPSTVTQVVPTQNSDFEQQLNAMEQKLQTQINTIQEKQDNQMKQILGKFEESMKLMVTSMNTMMVNMNKTIMDLSNPQLSSEQAVQHLIPIQNSIPHGGLDPLTQKSPHGGLPNTSVTSPSTQSHSTDMGVGALNQ